MKQVSERLRKRNKPLVLALLIMLALFAMPMAASADSFVEIQITQEMSVSDIGTAIRSGLQNNDRVVVTGEKTGVSEMLSLTGSDGKPVEWYATYVADASCYGYLISIGSNAVMELNGGEVSTTIGRAIPFTQPSASGISESTGVHFSPRAACAILAL